MAITWPAKANYNTGDVLTAANMNGIGDDLNDLYSGTGGAASGLVNRNPVLNSNFSVWQRGTSFSLAASTGYASGYSADRWDTSTGANQACTISRQTTGDTTNLPNIQYAARYQRNSGQTGTGELYFTQSFETVNSIPYAGKTVTLSFYARAGANYSAASSVLKSYFGTGTGTDQNVFLPFTGFASNTQNNTLTTTWQRFTHTYTIPSTVTQLAIYFGFTPTGTASTNDYYEITGVQIDLGSVALPYRSYGGTYQAELAACQRYYYKIDSTNRSPYALGCNSAATDHYFQIQLPVTMRGTPALTLSAASTFYVTAPGIVNVAGATIAAGTLKPDMFKLSATTASNANFSQGRFAILEENSGSSIQVSAEL